MIGESDQPSWLAEAREIFLLLAKFLLLLLSYAPEGVSLCHRLLEFDGQTVIAAVWHMQPALLAG